MVKKTPKPSFKIVEIVGTAIFVVAIEKFEPLMVR